MEPVDIGALKALGPRAVWVRIPPRALRRQRTTTTAFMNGWKSQWYGNRPGVEKVTVWDCPWSRPWVSKERSSAVAVCEAVSEFVHRTRPPRRTAIRAGLNLNEAMSTDAERTAGGTRAGARDAA